MNLPGGRGHRADRTAADQRLVHIVDAAFAEAARRSGPWLLCRPGCCQCCLGEFSITELDAERLRRGLAELDARDPLRAARIREAAARHPVGDDDPCPALDPQTGTCDLYAARPITCRTFGPPVRCESGDLGVCDLCFDGATEVEIAACAVDFDPQGLEASLLTSAEESTVAAAIRAAPG